MFSWCQENKQLENKWASTSEKVPSDMYAKPWLESACTSTQSGQSSSQQAHNIKMTSYQRRCDVITSHRRWYDVILTLCAHWDCPLEETLQLSKMRPVKIPVKLLEYAGWSESCAQVRFLTLRLKWMINFAITGIYFIYYLFLNDSFRNSSLRKWYKIHFVFTLMASIFIH